MKLDNIKHMYSMKYLKINLYYTMCMFYQYLYSLDNLYHMVNIK